MGQNIQSKEIGGLTVECVQFAPRRALRLVARIIRTLGPAIVPLVEAGSIKGANAESLLYAMASLTDDAADELAAAMLAGTTVSGAPDLPGRHSLSDAAKIDLVFPDLMAMLQACAFSLEVNFQNFSEAAATFLGKLQPAAKANPSS